MSFEKIKESYFNTLTRLGGEWFYWASRHIKELRHGSPSVELTDQGYVLYLDELFLEADKIISASSLEAAQELILRHEFAHIIRMDCLWIRKHPHVPARIANVGMDIQINEQLGIKGKVMTAEILQGDGAPDWRESIDVVIDWLLQQRGQQAQQNASNQQNQQNASNQQNQQNASNQQNQQNASNQQNQQNASNQQNQQAQQNASNQQNQQNASNQQNQQNASNQQNQQNASNQQNQQNASNQQNQQNASNQQNQQNASNQQNQQAQQNASNQQNQQNASNQQNQQNAAGNQQAQQNADSGLADDVHYNAADHQKAENAAIDAALDGRMIDAGMGQPMPRYMPKAVKPWRPRIWDKVVEAAAKLANCGARHLLRKSRSWAGVPILPKMKGFAKRPRGAVLVALDVSGSMAKYVENLMGLTKIGIKVYWCAHADRAQLFQLGQKLPDRANIGGGTQFKPVFELAKELGVTIIIWLTDGCNSDFLATMDIRKKCRARVIWVLLNQRTNGKPQNWVAGDLIFRADEQ
ncbi:MAG: hypothetical protein KatS3mg087_1155 [Patescibacteria group bacterium]|nr:MAG: hypothetical protein KatS3mg087_1155 [Patescibacteria group bacterium]